MTALGGLLLSAGLFGVAGLVYLLREPLAQSQARGEATDRTGNSQAQIEEVDLDRARERVRLAFRASLVLASSCVLVALLMALW
jgi:hypothetical protein